MKKTTYSLGFFLNEYGMERHALGSTEYRWDTDDIVITVWLGAIKADQLDTDEFDEVLEIINYINLVETICANNIDDWEHAVPLCRNYAHMFGDRCPYERSLEVMGETVQIKRGNNINDYKSNISSILEGDFLSRKMRQSIEYLKKVKELEKDIYNGILLFRM